MGTSSEVSASEPPNRGHSPRHWLLFFVLLIAAAVLVIFLGWMPRNKERQEIDRQARERTQAIPKIEVMKVVRAPSVGEVTIPGTTLAYTQAYIYARASGYLTKRLVDIGDRVRKGQLLAVVDAPDLDQQVAQGRSNLAQSESNLAQLTAQQHLAQLTWDRYRVLVGKGVFSRQDGDNQEANFRVAEANVNAGNSTVQANRDNLQRLIVLQQYEQVTAPFTGVITERNVDVGALISAQGTGQGSSPGSAGTTQAGAEGINSGAGGSLSSSVAPTTGGSQGGEMFAMAALDPLRILVSVPEAYASLIQLGQHADLVFQENPQQKFQGTVARTSSSIDQNTRTLLVELQVRNPTGRLLPGMYVVANFSHLKGDSLLIPGESIVVRNAQSMVAIIENNHVQFRPIQIGRDYGDQVEITSGLQPGDVIARIVTDQVQNGAEIQPQFPK